VAKEIPYEAVLFDLDDTLFNSSLMSATARRNAVRAIIEAGLELDEEETYSLLLTIVKKYGSNYGRHFDRLLEELGYQSHPKIIAAAVVAYHSTKFSLLKPFPDVIRTLLKLMKTLKIGIVSDGIKVKQWEKLIYLGIQHFFDVVVINDSPSTWKPAEAGFRIAMNKLGLQKPSKIAYVGNKIETDVLGANRIGITSVLFDPKKKIKISGLKTEEKPKHIITRTSEILEIIGLEKLEWKIT
jgi:putative hydrolase of the HAD superfamily